MGYLDYAGLQYLWGKLKEKFASKSHSHDDRYYTESEMDGKLNSKVNNNEAGANGLLSKLTTSWTATPTDNTYFIRQDTSGKNEFGRVKFSTIWSYIKGKADGVYQPKGSYAASGHTHDDRYYTEAEVNGKLTEKLHEETITDARDLNQKEQDIVVEDHGRKIAGVEQRVNKSEHGINVMMKALLALLSHGIDGNAIDPMKEAKAALESYLIDGQNLKDI
mgnify:CR=1 FL=1